MVTRIVTFQSEITDDVARHAKGQIFDHLSPSALPGKTAAWNGDRVKKTAWIASGPAVPSLSNHVSSEDYPRSRDQKSVCQFLGWWYCACFMVSFINNAKITSEHVFNSLTLTKIESSVLRRLKRTTWKLSNLNLPNLSNFNG